MKHIPSVILRFLLISTSILFLPFINLIKFYKINKFIRFLDVKLRKIRFKGDTIWKNFIRRGKTEKEFDQYREEIYMKSRYLGLINIINHFNVILTSHDNIFPAKILNKSISTERIYFSLKNDKIEIDKNTKIKLSFSGYLNKYRLEVLKLLCKDKNDFFNYNEIEEIIKFSKPRFIKKKYDGSNICSLHIKKSKEWPFSSPTRYINSINKNEIPLILDDFKDGESNY